MTLQSFGEIRSSAEGILLWDSSGRGDGIQPGPTAQEIGIVIRNALKGQGNRDSGTLSGYKTHHCILTWGGVGRGSDLTCPRLYSRSLSGLRTSNLVGHNLTRRTSFVVEPYFPALIEKMNTCERDYMQVAHEQPN